eukprot:9300531-Pyramimonas_sp.AAC.1
MDSSSQGVDSGPRQHVPRARAARQHATGRGVTLMSPKVADALHLCHPKWQRRYTYVTLSGRGVPGRPSAAALAWGSNTALALSSKWSQLSAMATPPAPAYPRTAAMVTCSGESIT